MEQEAVGVPAVLDDLLSVRRSEISVDLRLGPVPVGAVGRVGVRGVAVDGAVARVVDCLERAVAGEDVLVGNCAIVLCVSGSA